jgi:glycosyltransferase involved in cell wall biosynthesis
MLVGVHDGDLSGVNTYVENVAAAGATAVDDVTLMVADDQVARAVKRRLEGTGVRVVSLGMPPVTPTQHRLERFSPRYAARRLSSAVAAARPLLGGGFDAAHLNHPHLAEAIRPLAGRIFVAAWFYPHSLGERMLATWRDGGRRSVRAAGLALKAIEHYRNDARGFAAADTIVAPTRILAAQLRRAGFSAVHSAPPARVIHPPLSSGQRVAGSARRLLACSGDLGHPRKNLRLALDAVVLAAGRGQELELELVGSNTESLREPLRQMPVGVRVLLTGPLPAEEVHAHMGMADALLFPSRYEEWGFVAAEAALQGTPVVTLPVYPFGEMLGAPIGFCAQGVGAVEYEAAIGAALCSAAGRSEVKAAAESRFGLEPAGSRLAAIWSGEWSDGPHD